MVRRITRALLLSPVAFLLALGLASCADDEGIVAPALDDTITDREIATDPEPVPQVAAASSVREILASDRCRLPIGDFGRFTRVIDTAAPGTRTLDAAGGWSTCEDAPEDPLNTFTWSGDAAGFSWSSTVPVGAVVVWSGQQGVLHAYQPRASGDTGLQGPLDAAGDPLPVDGITIVHDYAIDVALDVVADPGAAVEWSLQPTVTPAAWQLLPGDRATSRAVIEVQKVVGEAGSPSVAATAVIANRSPITTAVTQVYAVIGGSLVFPTLPQPLPITLEPGDSFTAEFARDVTSTDASPLLVAVGTSGQIAGAQLQEMVSFDAPGTQIEIVTSDGQRLGPLGDSGQVVVERTFDAEALGEGAHTVPWSFAIDGVEGSGVDATVAVEVFAPVVVDRVNARFTRTFEWMVDVTSSGELLPDAFGVRVPLRVEARAVQAPDEDFGVKGSVELFNPHPSRALGVMSCTVELDGVTTALAVDAPIPPLGRKTLVVDRATEGAVARAVLSVGVVGSDLSWDGTANPGVATTEDRPLVLSYDTPTRIVDAAGRVDDTNVGALGPVSASAGTTVFETSVLLDDATPCGAASAEGTARLTTVDRGLIVGEDYAIAVEVPCDDDVCTRPASYWRHHLDDPVWERLDDGPATPLLDGVMSWADALGPGGGLYGQVAAQYASARLNLLAGASGEPVATALERAADILRTHDPRSLRGRDAALAARVAWELRRFNEGEVGPGACLD